MKSNIYVCDICERENAVLVMLCKEMKEFKNVKNGGRKFRMIEIFFNIE